ncbi:MAG: hypothetical protein OJF49_000256 [Ktedonobacterales bacterium]|jgi:uncharacterized membrane protein YeiH|nr:MAG: hypothetical protein OJF49_000256 [Ktedonobacterales bacterium]
MQPAVFNAGLEEALNLIGTFVFAMSGALLAVHKRYDIVGMIVLAEITAIGGGVLRDLILGAVPPAAFTDHVTLLIPLGAVAITFVVYRFIMHRHDQDYEHEQDQTTRMQHFRTRLPAALVRRYRTQIQVAVFVFDAAGLAVFCVAGAAKALAYGLGPVEAVALGTITGVGGGIMRDVLANEQPDVLRAESELYAVPAMLGAAIIVVLQHMHLYDSLTAGLAALFVFVLRLAALRYGWRAPQPKRRGGGEHDDAGNDTHGNA